MGSAVYLLLAAQFLSAFADNAVLFAVIALVLKWPQAPGWYVPALQSVFLAAYVLLAPWAGAYADRHPKARVLIAANLLKALGAGLLLLQVEPLLAYAVVGAGAAIYSPAKYGILPELAGRHALVKANGWMEGSTILAILTGMLAGGRLADYDVGLALACALTLLLASVAVTLLLPSGATQPGVPGCKPLLFAREIRGFLGHGRSRFAVLGGSLFWGAAACIRVVLIAWAPLVLGLHSAADISELTLALALGIVGGAALAPVWIPLEHLGRARFPAYAMAVFIVALGLSTAIWPARLALFALGVAGGLFIVPINATLQEIGHRSIGAGGAVAMQNFFQNVAMLLAVGGYTLAAAAALPPTAALFWLGGLLLAAALLLMRRLPRR